MPKYVFECQECKLRFDRNLKIGENAVHPCPGCKEAAPRVWDGQGFGFDFAPTPGTLNGNSGVTKHDYPTADQAVGQSASLRWQEIEAREEVKQKVRQGGGSKGLVRKHALDNSYIEYEAVTPERNEARKKLIQEVKQVEKAVESGDR